MLDYNIIQSKPTIVNNSYEYIDLLAETFYKDIQPKSTPLIVNEYYVARPDLISLAFYGSEKYTDVICKVNGISNPFELQEGRLIYLPNIEYASQMVSGIVINGSELISNSSVSSNNSNKVSSGDTILKKTSSLQKERNEKRTPGDQVVGETNYVIDKTLGVVFY